MGIPKDILREESGLSDWCILSGYRGSIVHGMHQAPSHPDSIDDIDVMAICVEPKDYLLGLKEYGSKGTKEIKRNEWDIVIYTAQKFIRLLSMGNPNVLSLLWLEPNHYLVKTKAGQLLVDKKAMFVGRHVYKSFVGYAHGQLHRMTHSACQGYMGAKRKGLVEKFGYDTKNAAHLIRLLRMGIEFLKDGELNVLRQDAQQLLEIKRGEWTLDQVKAESDRLFKLCDDVYVVSTLPKGPDMDKVNALCVEVVETAWKGRNA